jgi:hypothetical protein
VLAQLLAATGEHLAVRLPMRTAPGGMTSSRGTRGKGAGGLLMRT